MLPWLLCLVLAIAVLALAVKVGLLRRSMDQLREGMEERLSTDTNTLLAISSRDRSARRLAADLNRQLRQLRAQRRRLQSGDRELKEAVTNISHDLRTPLTAIRGYLDLLAREEQTPEAARYLKLISDRAEAMTRLSEELLRCFVLLSAEELRQEPTDLRAAVEEAAAGAYAALTARGIVPDIVLPDRPVVRRLDRGALSRVLENILSNALKYSAGDLEIVLTEDGTLRCANAAPGLDEVAAGRLFDRFFTVEAARSSTGLGLSIVKTLTERMGGTAGAEYREGRLCVWVRFAEDSRAAAAQTPTGP